MAVTTAIMASSGSTNPSSIPSTMANNSLTGRLLKVFPSFPPLDYSVIMRMIS